MAGHESAGDMTDPKQRHIHLVSDSTGETLHTITRAALAPFPGVETALHVSVFVRSANVLKEVIDGVQRNPGLVIFTLADHSLRHALQAAASDLDVPCVAPLDPVVESLSTFFATPPADRPGMQHRISNAYFDRVAALDFAIAHDDGALGNRLLSADVILTGVSRTSKTPTCIYLAYRGIKAANMPLVPHIDPDPAFFTALDSGVPVIGLTASPSRLSQIRTQRLETLGAGKSADYAEIDRIRTEVTDARLFFDRYEIPVIDVTRRSIEETSAEILVILRGLGKLNE